MTENTFLGYTIDYTLSHTSHIEKLCKRMASANYALLKLKPLLDKKSLLSVYYAYIQSIVRYAITVWGNATDVQKVLKSQKRAIRIMFGLPKRTSVRNYFKNNQIMTVISLYIFNSLLEIHDNKINMNKNKDVHSYNLRNREKLFKYKTKLEKVKKQGIYNKISMYNQLPNNVTNLNNNDFKKVLKEFFEINPFYSVNEFMVLRLTQSSFSYKTNNK